MKNLLQNLSCFLLITVSASGVKGQPAYEDNLGVLREVVVVPSARTIQLYREGWPQSYPVIRLKDDVPLVLEFDDLTAGDATFSYTVIHCNADWTRSELTEQEFLEGYPENDMPGGTPSFNTYTTYNHHELSIPNENLRLKVSGNFLLVVFRNYDPEDVVFTRRFMVTEASVHIEATAGFPQLQKYRGCCQEVDFTVQHRGMDIQDPYNDATAIILQNGLWDVAVGPLPPYMVRPDELVYDYHEENIFPGGNEYRFFDTKNTRIPTYYIQNIEFIHPYFHFTLKPDQPNPYHVYQSREDINGRYHIESEDSRDPGVDADYVFVHFRLEMKYPLEGSVYVAGALTNWQFNDMNRMEYREEEGAYVASLLLKQGVYNYRYLFLPTLSEQFDLTEIEGSFSETGNEYLILFYHRPPGQRYDRLLGHQVVHSNQ